MAVMLLLSLELSVTGCTEANQVSHNVSNEADNFNVLRRLTVINTRTDKPEFELIGAFSLQVDHRDNQIEVICELDDGSYKKHIIGLNDETMYVVEDLGGAQVNKYKYEVNFLPETILPFDLVTKE